MKIQVVITSKLILLLKNLFDVWISVEEEYWKTNTIRPGSLTIRKTRMSFKNCSRNIFKLFSINFIVFCSCLKFNPSPTFHTAITLQRSYICCIKIKNKNRVRARSDMSFISKHWKSIIILIKLMLYILQIILKARLHFK